MPQRDTDTGADPSPPASDGDALHSALRALQSDQEDRQRLQLALQAAELGTWEWDPGSGRVRLSEEVECFFGFAPGTFAGTLSEWLSRVHPDDLERVQGCLQRCAAQADTSLEIDHRILRCDGQLRWLHQRGRLSREPGSPILRGICMDISDRMRREQREDFLADATQLFATCLDHQATLRSLARLAVPRIADYFALYLGDDEQGLDIAVLAHADPARESLAWDTARRWPPARRSSSPLRRVFRERQPRLLASLSEDDLRATAQEPAHAEALLALDLRSAMLLPLESGERVFGVLCLVNGSTRPPYGDEELLFASALAGRTAQALDNLRLYAEAAQARASAERAAARLHLLAEAGNLLALHMKPDGALQALADLAVLHLADYCITYVQEKGKVRRVGLAHVERGQRPLLEVFERLRPISLQDEEGAGRVLRTGEALLLRDIDETMLQRYAEDPGYQAAVRQLQPRSSIIVPLHARGRTIGAAAFVFSARSGRHYGEQDLALLQELAGRAALQVDNARLYAAAQQAVRLRDELVAMVSHDLRSPLNTIVTSAAVLELEPPADRRAKALTAIRRASAQMGRLVHDLLDISRIEAGGLPVTTTALPPAALVAEALGLFHDRAEALGVELRQSVPADLPRVRADRERILQVLSNLLDNALRHVTSGGRVELTVEPAGEALRFVVRDDGPGVPEELQEQVFQRFWQASSGLRGGAGLGLTIAKAIVEAHGGVIAVSNASEGGARFSFTLPCWSA